MRRLARIGKKAVRFDLYVRVFSLDISNSGTDLEGVYVELVRGGRNDRTKEHKFDSSMWTGDEPLSVPVTLYKDMKRGCFQTKPFTLNLRSSQDDSSLSIYTLDAAQFANALDGVGNTSTRTLKLSAVKGKSKLKNVQLTVTVGCVFKSEPTGDGETSTVMTGTSTMLDEQDLSGFEESDLSTTIQEFDDENDGLDGTFDGENGAFDTLLEDVDKLLTPDRRKSEPRMGVGATMEDEIVGDLVASDEDRTSLQEKYQKSVSEVTSSSPSEALQQGRSEALESAEDAIALLQALEANEDRRVDGGPTPMITADSETDDTIRAISENMVAETSTIMEGLRSDISLAISKRQEDSDRHSKVLGELSVAKAIIKELREALNTSETLKASAKEEIDDLRKQLQAAEGDSLQAAEAANMAIDTMNSMEMKYQAAKDATESAEARASAAEKAREGSDTAASQAKAVMRLELESALRALQEAKAEAEEAVASANAEAEEAATAQEMAASAAEDVASAAATRIGELEAEITKLREEMNKVHDLSKIAVEEAEAKAEDAVAKTTLAALADASASGERMTSLQEQLTSQKTENQEMSKKLAEMEQVNNTMHADLKAARAEALKEAEAANNASTIVHDLEMQINAAEARAAAAETATQAKEWQMVKLASEATTAAEAAQKSELGMRAATEAAQAQANEAIAKVKAEADEAVEAAAAAAAASSSPSIEATQMTDTWRKRALEAEQKCSSLDRRIEYLQSELQHNHDNFAMRARNDDILGEDEANDTSADSKSLTRKATQLLETTQMRLCAALESLGDSGAKAVQLSVEAAAEDLKNGTTTATAIEGAATMIDELLELLIADVKRRTALMPVNTTDGKKKTSHTATESNPGTSNFEESVKEQLEVARRTTELEMAVENGRREVLRLQALLGTARADADAAEVASEEFATELDALKTEIFKADLEKSEELAKLRASHLSEVALLRAEVEKLSIQVNIDDNIESNISNSPNSTTGEASSTFDDRHTRSGIDALKQKLAESSKAIKNNASHLQSMQKYSENLREEISGKVRCLACSEFIDLNSTKEHYCIAARRQSDPEILKARAAAQIAATAAKTNSKPVDPLKASSFLSSLKAKRSSFFK